MQIVSGRPVGAEQEGQRRQGQNQPAFDCHVVAPE
jgi:hypothetical protein